MMRIFAICILAAMTILAPPRLALAEEEAPAAPIPAASAKQIGIEDFISLIRNNPETALLDVNRQQFYDLAHFKGSQYIPLEGLENRITEVNMSRPIVVYCQTGNRSSAAAAILLKKTPSAQLYELSGGILSAFELITKEPEIISADPGKKQLFDTLRNKLSVVFTFPGLPVQDLLFADNKGKTAAPSKFKGKTAVFAFFDAGEPKQIDEIMGLRTRLNKKKLNRVAVVPVAVTRLGAGASKVKEYFKKKKWTGEYWIDAAGENQQVMSLQQLPNFILVDAGGVIRALNIWQTSKPVDAYGDISLEEMIAMSAAGKLPPYPLTEDRLNEVRQSRLTGKTAADFTLPDPDGKNHRLSEIAKGQGALLIFGSAQCPYTLHELELANKCGAGNLPGGFRVAAVLAVFGEQDLADVKKFIGEKKITYPVMIDRTGETMRKYYVTAVPSWWVISPGGKALYRENGYIETICETAAGELKK